MTPDERELTPEQESEVSRLLADAAGPVATPPEVVTRLDDVLTGLLAERVSADTAATVAPPVSLETERRRRRWPRALLAAAAVAAGGYGVGAALTGTPLSGDSESAVSADAGGRTAGSTESQMGGRAAEGPADSSTTGRTKLPSDVNGLLRRPPLLRPERLAEDIARLVGTAEGRRRLAAPSPSAVHGSAAASTCLPTDLGPDDTWFLVRYDGRQASLVTAAPVDGSVRAVVRDCEGGRLASVTVPVG